MHQARLLFVALLAVLGTPASTAIAQTEGVDQAALSAEEAARLTPEELGALYEVKAIERLEEAKTDPLRDPSYTISLTQYDVEALVRGEGLDEADPWFCEKQRDVCLAVTCGAVDRARIEPACWEHCTNQGFSKCHEPTDLQP